MSREKQAAELRRMVDAGVERLNAELVAERDRYKRERDALCSAVKQHRNATESRLRLLATAARQPESSDCMLKPDRDLYEVLDSFEGGT